MKIKLKHLFCVLFLFFATNLYADSKWYTLLTYADGRSDGGIRQSAEGENSLDSPGGIFVFDQKLLGKDQRAILGRNAGFCVRTDPGAPDFSSTDHPELPDDPDNNFGQCTWTLTFSLSSGTAGSITVSGREADKGASELTITGGTGHFNGIMGTLITTPIPQDSNGVLFKQRIKYRYQSSFDFERD